MSYIYGIVHKESGKYLYIGQTKRENPKQTRWKEHQRDIKNQKHKIKGLNTYSDKIEQLEFEILCEVESENSLILSTLENFYNSLLHPLNRCVLQGFGSNTVTFKREENEDLCKSIIELIQEYY